MDLFNFIKSNTSMLDIAQEYTTCKKTGSTYWKGRCPFHHEKTASFTVSPDKNIFYCFGCHQGGDAIAFIAKIENCTQFQAAQFLAEKYNLQVPESIQYTKQSSQDKDIYSLHQCITQWCQKQLAKNKSVIQYLMNRGFSEKQIKSFQLDIFLDLHMLFKHYYKKLAKKASLPKILLMLNF